MWNVSSALRSHLAPSRLQVCTYTEPCEITLTGHGFAAADSLKIIDHPDYSCGDSTSTTTLVGVFLTQTASLSSGYTEYSFGTPSDGRIDDGYKLCWGSGSEVSTASGYIFEYGQPPQRTPFGHY